MTDATKVVVDRIINILLWMGVFQAIITIWLFVLTMFVTATK